MSTRNCYCPQNFTFYTNIMSNDIDYLTVACRIYAIPFPKKIKIFLEKVFSFIFLVLFLYYSIDVSEPAFRNALSLTPGIFLHSTCFKL